MNDYTDLPGFQYVVLEESFVLAIKATPGAFRLDVEILLQRDHPRYVAPAPHEFGCFRTGYISFTGVARLLWQNQGVRAAIDASGQEDYGNIDSFTWEGGSFYFSGNFGEVEISSREVLLGFDLP